MIQFEIAVVVVSLAFFGLTIYAIFGKGLTLEKVESENLDKPEDAQNQNILKTELSATQKEMTIIKDSLEELKRRRRRRSRSKSKSI
jgi:hypothetical protein